MNPRTLLLSKIELFAVLGVFILSAPGCNKAPNGGIPIYVRIDSPTVISNSYFGSASNSIVDVWASSGAQTLGAFEMPVNIPVLANGNTPILCGAGILETGIYGQRIQYPFYRPDTFTIPNAIPGHVYHHHPVYSYFSNAIRSFNCDFEGYNDFTGMTPIAIPRGVIDSAVYEGLGSGGIIMMPGDTTLTATQTAPVTVTTNGRQAYVELNYKMSISSGIFCDVGLITTLANGTQKYYSVITLTPSKGYWNKIYLDFSQQIGGDQGGNATGPGCQIYFTTYRSYQLIGNRDTMFFDNVKILNFQ